MFSKIFGDAGAAGGGQALSNEQQAKFLELEQKLKAVSNSQAIIEFKPDGTILDANENFLAAMGYSKDEIVGKHHSMFVDAETKSSLDYKNFWPSLAQGVGYQLNEIVGKHHRMFVDPVYANSSEYANFWNELNRGSFSAGEYMRINKAGEQIWIQASYNPVFDQFGKPVRIVKFATDITENYR